MLGAYKSVKVSSKPRSIGDTMGMLFGSGLKVKASKEQVKSMPTVGSSKSRQKGLASFLGAKSSKKAKVNRKKSNSKTNINLWKRLGGI